MNEINKLIDLITRLKALDNGTLTNWLSENTPFTLLFIAIITVWFAMTVKDIRDRERTQ